MTDELKIAMLHHVRYEITHCMIIPAWREDAALLKEAVFLAFFVHARNLIQFFEREVREKKDDLLAADYGFPPVSLAISAADRARYGKDMMHLTTKRERHTTKTKPWPILTTYHALKPVATNFAMHVVAHFGARLSAGELSAWTRLLTHLESTGERMILAEEMPNQLPEPTRVAVTTSADAELAPAPRVAHR